MNGDDKLNISGRDFGRLEGKVDGIALDVGELKTQLGGIGGRVSTLESAASVLAAVDTAKFKNEGIETGQLQVVQLSRQTLIMLLSVIVAVVSIAFGVFAYMH